MLAIISKYQKELNLAMTHEHKVADEYARVYAEKEARGRVIDSLHQEATMWMDRFALTLNGSQELPRLLAKVKAMVDAYSTPEEIHKLLSYCQHMIDLMTHIIRNCYEVCIVTQILTSYNFLNKNEFIPRFYSKNQCESNHSHILSLACIHFLHTPHVWFFRKNAITKRAPRHPYRTRSKSRMMGDQEEVQEQMKADMSTLKEQMDTMMDAMLGMRQLMENNVATAAAVSSAVEADPTLPATAHHPIPNVVGQERSTLGYISIPHLGYNRVAYPYGLPPNYMPPVIHDDAGHVPPPILEGEPPRQSDEVHEDRREHAQGDIDSYSPVPVEGPAPNTLPQPNLTGEP